MKEHETIGMIYSKKIEIEKLLRQFDLNFQNYVSQNNNEDDINTTKSSLQDLLINVKYLDTEVSELLVFLNNVLNLNTGDL